MRSLVHVWLGLVRMQVEDIALEWREPRVWREGDETVCEWTSGGRALRAYVRAGGVDLMREAWGEDWAESELVDDFQVAYAWLYRR